MEKVSERIYLLEGEATYNPDPIPQVGDNADDFLKLDHEAENYAILVYRKIIEETRALQTIALGILCKRHELENLNRYFKRLGVEVLSMKEAYRKVTGGVKV